ESGRRAIGDHRWRLIAAEDAFEQGARALEGVEQTTAGGPDPADQRVDGAPGRHVVEALRAHDPVERVGRQLLLDRHAAEALEQDVVATARLPLAVDDLAGAGDRTHRRTAVVRALIAGLEAGHGQPAVARQRVGHHRAI